MSKNKFWVRCTKRTVVEREKILHFVRKRSRSAASLASYLRSVANRWPNKSTWSSSSKHKAAALQSSWNSVDKPDNLGFWSLWLCENTLVSSEQKGRLVESLRNTTVVEAGEFWSFRFWITQPTDPIAIRLKGPFKFKENRIFLLSLLWAPAFTWYMKPSEFFT